MRPYSSHSNGTLPQLPTHHPPGNVTFEEYANLTTPSALRARLGGAEARVAIGGESNLRVGCLDEQANTYDASGDLHSRMLCLYTTDPILASLEELTTGEWCLLLLNTVAASYLSFVLSSALIFVLGAHTRALNAACLSAANGGGDG